MLSLIHNKTVQGLSAWVGLAATAFTVLSKWAPEWFGALTWPQSILLGIGLAITAGLALAVALAIGGFGYRLIRPLSASSSRELLPKLDFTPVDKLRGEISEKTDLIFKRIGAVDSELRKMVDIIEDRLVAAEEAANGATNYAKGASTAQDHLLSELQEVRHGIVREFDKQRDFQKKIEHWVESIRESFLRQIGNIDQGFMAILDRENLLKLAIGIENVGDALSGPTRGEPVEDWEAWFKGYKVWRRDVENWARIAGAYREGVTQRVFDTPDECYRGKWEAKAEYFPDAMAVRDYRTFRIVLRNFHAERTHVDNQVRMAAFIRPSMKGRVNPLPSDEDQLPLPQKVQP